MIQMAVWLILCIIGYLRPSENMGLRRGDVMKPSPSTTTWTLLLAPSEIGALTKVGEQDDSVPGDNPHYLWLTPILAGLKDGDRELPL